MTNDFEIAIKSARVNIYNPESGNSYTVLLNDNDIQCDCKSFEFCIEPKGCKHIAYILEKFRGLLPDKVDEEI